MATAAQTEFQTSGLVRLSKPQLIGTLGGLLFALLLAAIDQTIVGTAEPRIIASLSGFDRYPWVATAYMLSMTVSVPIFAGLCLGGPETSLRCARKCAMQRRVASR